MNLVQLVENKDYVGFKDKMEELVEESLLNLFKEAKDEITSKAKVDLDESMIPMNMKMTKIKTKNRNNNYDAGKYF